MAGAGPNFRYLVESAFLAVDELSPALRSITKAAEQVSVITSEAQKKLAGLNAQFARLTESAGASSSSVSRTVQATAAAGAGMDRLTAQTAAATGQLELFGVAGEQLELIAAAEVTAISATTAAIEKQTVAAKESTRAAHGMAGAFAAIGAVANRNGAEHRHSRSGRPSADLNVDSQ